MSGKDSQSDILREYMLSVFNLSNLTAAIGKSRFYMEARHRKALCKNGEFTDELVCVKFKDEC